MVLSLIIGNSFCKSCSAEKPMLKGKPFLRMKRLKYNFLSWGQVSSTQKNGKKVCLILTKMITGLVIPFVTMVKLGRGHWGLLHMCRNVGFLHFHCWVTLTSCTIF